MTRPRRGSSGADVVLTSTRDYQSLGTGLPSSGETTIHHVVWLTVSFTLRTLPSNKDTKQAPDSIAWRFRMLQLATVGIDWGGAAGGL